MSVLSSNTHPTGPGKNKTLRESSPSGNPLPQGILYLRRILSLRESSPWKPFVTGREMGGDEPSVRCRLQCPTPPSPWLQCPWQGKQIAAKPKRALTLLLLQHIRLLLFSSLLQIFSLWKISGENKFSLLEDHVHFEEERSKTYICFEQGIQFAQRMERNGTFEMFSLKTSSNKQGKNKLRP